MEGIQRRYECQVCGYIYDPESGDDAVGTGQGAAFEELPPGWLCPWCDSPPDRFEPYVEWPEPEVEEDDG